MSHIISILFMSSHRLHVGSHLSRASQCRQLRACSPCTAAASVDPKPIKVFSEVKTSVYHSYNNFSVHAKLLKDCDEVEVSVVIALNINLLSVTPIFCPFKALYVEHATGNYRNTLQFLADFSCIAARFIFVYQERFWRQALHIVCHHLNTHLNISCTIFTHTHHLKLE